MTTKNCVDSAKGYAARGWHVFPVPPGKKQSYKSAEHSRGRKWGATLDAQEIAQDWIQWPNANVGIVTGPKSGLLVIEADTEAGHGVDGVSNLAALFEKHGPLPETIEALSPSGSWHIYFKWPEERDTRNSVGKVAPGVDVRGNGGMVLAPPSVKTGQDLPYRWKNQPGRFDLAECPEWLLDLCEKLSERATSHIHTLPPIGCDASEVRELLSYIPADCGYDDWLSVLMGIHARYGGAQQGLGLADEWSAQGQKYVPGEVNQKWNSFNGHGVNWETVPALARQNGADLSEIARKHKAPTYMGMPNMDFSNFKTFTPDPVERQSQFFRASDLDGIDIPPREWLVKGLVPMNTVSSLYGDGGTGKSLVALQLAVAVASDTKWLRQDVRQGNALFISAEDDADELHRRMANVAGSLGLGLADLSNLHMRSLAGEDALLAKLQKDGSQEPTALFAEIDRYTEETSPTVMILDTLADLFPGNENDRTQARQFIGLLRGLAIRHRCSVLLLAHPSLSGMNSGTGSGGNTAWNNSVRSRLYLERVTIKDQNLTIEPDPDARTLGTKKANYGRAGGEIAMKWQAGVFVAQEQPTGLDAVAASLKAERVFMILLRTFTEQGRSVNEKTASTYAPKVFADHPDSQGISKRLFKQAMEILLKDGKIKIVEEGPPSKLRTRFEAV